MRDFLTEQAILQIDCIVVFEAHRLPTRSNGSAKFARSMTFSEYLNKVGIDPNGAFLREGLQLLAQLTMELEVSKQIGAAKYERSADRTTQWNGYRGRQWDMGMGGLALQIPQLRQGTYFASLLEPRRRAERTLLNVVQQAYISRTAPEHGSPQRSTGFFALAGTVGTRSCQTGRCPLPGKVPA